ncbi:MAG TPA: replication protein [Bacteroidia bacterium]|nr:replication protein [Bacteroidia bacterium]
MHTRTTSVPNALFDIYLRELNSAELKVLLVIIRQTLGWTDKYSLLGRKECDWISGSQLQSKTGNSRRAISSAVETLITKELIEVTDARGNLLSSPEKRKGKSKLFFRLTPTLFSPVENVGKKHSHLSFMDSASAKFAQDFSKKVTALAQKMRMTKETLQN